MKESFYQVSTMYPLFKTKVICKNEKEIFKHLDLVIFKTEKLRSKMNELDKKNLSSTVTGKELEDFIVILKIDPKIEPRILNFLGTTM